jgi:hypothetical protein
VLLGTNKDHVGAVSLFFRHRLTYSGSAALSFAEPDFPLWLWFVHRFPMPTSASAVLLWTSRDHVAPVFSSPRNLTIARNERLSSLLPIAAATPSLLKSPKVTPLAGFKCPELYEFGEDAAVVAQRSHYSRVAAFIDDRELARALSRVAQAPVSTHSSNEPSDARWDIVSWYPTHIRGRSSTLRFFVGLEAHLRQSLLESPFAATLMAPPSRGAKLVYDREVLPTGEHAPRDSVTVQAESLAAASDGTVWITTLER